MQRLPAEVQADVPVALVRDEAPVRRARRSNPARSAACTNQRGGFLVREFAHRIVRASRFRGAGRLRRTSPNNRKRRGRALPCAYGLPTKFLHVGQCIGQAPASGPPGRTSDGKARFNRVGPTGDASDGGACGLLPTRTTNEAGDILAAPLASHLRRKPQRDVRSRFRGSVFANPIDLTMVRSTLEKFNCASFVALPSSLGNLSSQ